VTTEKEKELDYIAHTRSTQKDKYPNPIFKQRNRILMGKHDVHI